MNGTNGMNRRLPSDRRFLTRWAVVVCMGLLLTTSVPDFAATAQEATPIATSEDDRQPSITAMRDIALSRSIDRRLYECHGIPTYVAARSAAIPVLTSEEWRVIEKWDAGELFYDTARPAEAAMLSSIFERTAAAMELIPEEKIPYILEDVHISLIRQYSMLASGYHAVIQGDYLAVLAYTEQEEKIYADLDAVWERADQVCDNALTEAWEGE